MSRPGVFFVHIMKTGGTSLSRSLRELFDSARSYPSDENAGPDAKLRVGRLLDMDEQQRAQIAYYSVHMPAWVAERIAPEHVTVTVLREPVARTVSHLRHIARSPLAPDDLDEIYDDPQWRGRVANYQTRMLGQTEHDHEALAAAADSISFDDTDDDAMHELAVGMELFMRTGVVEPTEMTDHSLRTAMARIERIDELGVTEDLASVAARLSRRLGREVPEPMRLNPARNELAVSPALAERIRADCELDRQLYEHALDLIASATT